MAGLKVMRAKAGMSLALGISVLALVSACDNGPSAVSKQQAAGTQMATANAPERSYGSDRGGGYDNAPKVDHRKDEVAKAEDGKPMWAPSKRFSAEEGAQRQFERDGEAFGAKTVDQYVRKAHAFVGHPPKGTLTLTRKNGDILYYDPKGNVFAVASKEGAPRTMFKPDEGMAYWEKQKDREARSQSARSGRRSRSADDQAD
jgi:pyocin large subunit-like protein